MKKKCSCYACGETERRPTLAQITGSIFLWGDCSLPELAMPVMPRVTSALPGSQTRQAPLHRA